MFKRNFGRKKEIKKDQKSIEISEEIRKSIENSRIFTSRKKTIEEKLKIRRIRRKVFNKLNSHHIHNTKQSLEKAVFSLLLEKNPKIVDTISIKQIEKDVSNYLPDIYLKHINKGEKNVSINRVILETSEYLGQKYK
ncbi:MAG: hypothetical protein PHR26_01370 [Candidatus ainarchaeum sp.]|nr:hypothetical protein [Candidatus ainarchaeum sp.]MDD3976288.1 hypothetical protein [Candidatus ainarchaeum sp.]